MTIVHYDARRRMVDGFAEEAFGKVILSQRADGHEELLVFPESIIHIDMLSVYEGRYGKSVKAWGANYRNFGSCREVCGSSSSMESLPESEFERLTEALFPSEA